MSKAAWPAAAELTSALAGLGVTLPSGWAAQDLVSAAIHDWEGDTGVSPFLATAPSTRAYTATYTALTPISPVVAVTEVTLAGAALTRDVHYWLEPQDAESRGRPFTAIRWRAAQGSAPGALVVTGVHAWGSTVPIDAWFAVLHRAVDYAVGIAALGAQGGSAAALVRVRQADIELGYGDGVAVTVLAWREEWIKLVRGRYRLCL